MDYWQAFFTPYNVMVRDMLILNIESEIKETYRRAKQKQKQSASGRKK